MSGKPRSLRIQWQGNGPVDQRGNDSLVVINPAVFLMKHYNDLRGQHRPLWLLPRMLAHKAVEEQVSELVADRVDLLLLPCFIWNLQMQLEVSRLFKARCPDACVVLGGPELDAHKDPDWFVKHPWVDYVVYGDGERALTDIIDYRALGRRRDWVNTVENLGDRSHVWPHEILRDQEYWSTSPYLGQKQFIRDSLEAMYALGYSNTDTTISVEFSRGCMYRCVFCDWSQGLHNKVVRRKADWKRELDFFKELDVAIRETDANFGQWDEDVQIYDYAQSIHDPDKHFKFVVSNTAKLKKNADHFYLGNSRYNKGWVIMSMQDTEEEVLHAIDRPGLSWPQHAELIDRVRHRLGEQRFKETVRVELIVGLPKQTLATFMENFVKIHSTGIRILMVHPWVAAKNAPGLKSAYLDKYGVEFKRHRVWQSLPGTRPDPGMSVGEIYDLARTPDRFLSQDIVWRTAHMDYRDIMTVQIAASMLSTVTPNPIRHKFDLLDRMPTEQKEPELRKLLKGVMAYSQDHAHRLYQAHLPHIQEHGFVVPYHLNPRGEYTSTWKNIPKLRNPHT